MSAPANAVAALEAIQIMACDAHDHTSEVDDRANAAIAAVKRLIEAAKAVPKCGCRSCAELEAAVAAMEVAP